MIYEIHSRSDILSGAELIIKMPEEDIDRKALYTIQEDKPEFLLPFRYRIVDGHAEFVYQIGSQSKLQYLAGERFPKEYTALWSSILNPLCICGDWFLRPYSFVLATQYLYCNKNNDSVGYVYIPSKRDCSDYSDLKEMAANIAAQIIVTDPDLENRVLRAIMMEFNPKTFIQMLKAFTAISVPVAYIPAAIPQRVYEPAGYITAGSAQIEHEEEMQEAVAEIEDLPRSAKETVYSDDIIIDLSGDWKAEKKKKERRTNKRRSEKDEKSKNNEGLAGFFKKRKELKQDTIIGLDPLLFPAAKNTTTRQVYEQHSPLSSVNLPAAAGQTSDLTQCISYEIGGARLRLVGNASLPTAINVAITEGEVFTVGRYDTAVGKARSSYEFERTTKAVSRRHAAIERMMDGYALIDLASSAGTFLDGQKLPPNTPCKLQPGCKVSFGNCGADYIWEQ